MATISSSEKLDLASDPRMPFIGAALDRPAAQAELLHNLPDLVQQNGPFHLAHIGLVRYKPGRRCLIEYDLEFVDGSRVQLLGKSRAKGLDMRGYETQRYLHDAGFDETSEDEISVPRPLGLVPRFQMWVQQKVRGVQATELLAMRGSESLSRRIAEALHKLHATPVPTTRRHSTADEMRILRERLRAAQSCLPHRAERLRRTELACQALAARLRVDHECGIHRDFYPDQIVVDDRRLYLVDLDLYCRGDASLDAGNYLAHLTERGIRESSAAGHLASASDAFTKRYLSLAAAPNPSAIAAFTTLALARHIHLSRQFPDRRFATDRLIQLCERRLGLSDAGRRECYPTGPIG